MSGLDGTSDLQFNITVSNSLYIVIQHRNHLAVISAYPLTIINDYCAYDFTTAAGKAYGSANGIKELASGIWGMVSGDGNADGAVDQSDKLTEWELNAGEHGYLFSDYNMNGQVSNEDKDNYWLPNVGFGSQVP